MVIILTYIDIFSYLVIISLILQYLTSPMIINFYFIFGNYKAWLSFKFLVLSNSHKIPIYFLLSYFKTISKLFQYYFDEIDHDFNCKTHYVQVLIKLIIINFTATKISSIYNTGSLNIKYRYSNNRNYCCKGKYNMQLSLSNCWTEQKSLKHDTVSFVSNMIKFSIIRLTSIVMNFCFKFVKCFISG